MALHDYVIADANGATFLADLNAALQAALTNNSDAGDPTTTAAGMWHYDTDGLWKIRNPSDNAFLTVGPFTDAGFDVNGCKGADIASHATTADIGAATGGYLDVTGTTGITAFPTVAAGVRRWVRFTGALTLTHNGTSLQLPGAANIVTVAGDIALFVSLGSGNWKCAVYQRYAGEPLKGCLGYAQTAQGAQVNCSTDLPVDNSIPQSIEGDEVIALAYTPKNASSKLEIRVAIPVVTATAPAYASAALFKDSGATALAAVTEYAGGATVLVLTRTLAATDLSARTYKVRVGPDVGGAASVTTSAAAGATMGDKMYTEMSITEYI